MECFSLSAATFGYIRRFTWQIYNHNTNSNTLYKKAAWNTKVFSLTTKEKASNTMAYHKITC